MPLSPVELPRQRSRADELYQWLREAILSGELLPHERLVETTIAELAAVSRTPVREALQRLEIDGLVREGGVGLEVCGFSLAELADVCAVRETLEGMATGLAARWCSEIEFSTLQRIVHEEELLREAADDDALAARIELNHSFHESLWRASRNSYLADELRKLRNLIERLQVTTLREPERIKEALSEHRAIIEAIKNQDPSTAEQLSREHFRHAMVRRLSRLADGRRQIAGLPRGAGEAPIS